MSKLKTKLILVDLIRLSVFLFCLFYSVILITLVDVGYFPQWGIFLAVFLQLCGFTLLLVEPPTYEEW